MQQPLSARPLVSAGTAAFTYAVLFAALMRNWVVVATDSVAATSPFGVADARLIVWVLDWVHRGLLTDWSRLLDAPINHPAAAQLTGTEHFLTAQLLYSPLRLAVGQPIIAANLTAMLTYPLTATAMYAFSTAAGVGFVPAFASGALLALGPFQTPANLHVLQHLPLFLPLAALALLRLRQAPGWRRTIVLALVLFAGMASSYYMAFMLCAALVPWALVEIGSAPRLRTRLASAALAALLVAIVALLVLSMPYLARAGEAGRPPWTEWSSQATVVLRLLRQYAVGGQDSLGLPLLFASTLAISAAFARDLRRYVIASLVVAASGMFLALGGTGLVASWNLPGVLGDLAQLAGRFFYIYPRGLLLVSFAGCVLAALGLESLRRAAPRAGNAAAAAILIVVMLTRGPALGASVLSEVDAFTRHSGAYARIGSMVGAGGGSLLEMPRQPREGLNDSRAMMGQLIHRVPLITGHTGYLPAARRDVDEAVRKLPDPQALRWLVQTTELRWIILRPQADWRGDARNRFLHGLEVGGWVRELRSAGDLLLVEVGDPIGDGGQPHGGAAR